MNYINQKINVLDKGFVRLVNHMGDDSSIVQAARVSYGKGTKSVSEDEQLIRYLLRHKHTSPFEMCEIVFHVKVPMDVWRQWIRHRMASVNEYSTRYSVAIDDKHETKIIDWRFQSKNNKQGSDEFLSQKVGKELSNEEQDLHNHIKQVYEKRLEYGVAREQARKDLPLSNYTEAYWKIDLHNLLHFLKLRLDSHAQLEIREYANAIAKFIEQLFPMTWRAFNDYELNSITFSKNELLLLQPYLYNIELYNTFELLSKGETNELKEKLNKIKEL